MSDNDIHAEIILADGSKYIDTHRGYDIVILDFSALEYP